MAPQNLDLESRLDILTGVVVDQFERKYRATSAGSYQERLRVLVAASIRSFAKSIGIDLAEDASVSEAMSLYSLRSAIRQQRIESKSLTRVLDILQQLLILASTLDQRTFTLEKAWRVLDRLEMLLTGRTSNKGVRTARIATAEPINMRDLLDSIGWNQALAVQLLETRIRSTMKSTLLGLQSQRSLQKT